MSELRWAPPTPEQNDAWEELLGAMEAVDRRGEVYTAEDLADQWSSVWSDPERTSTFVWDGDQLVAFAWLKVMPGGRSTHKVSCWGGVRPSHRRRGIGTRLLRWELERGTEARRDLDPAYPLTFSMEVGEWEDDLLAVADRAGFAAERRFLEVTRPTSLPLVVVPPPAGVAVRPWTEPLDEPTRLAHCEAFADHWGSEPRTAHEWRQWYTGHRAFRPDLSRVAVDLATGEVVGYVLAAAYPADWVVSPIEAWINTVGTRPAWRGRGISRALMTDCLAAVAADGSGFVRAVLGVDAANPTGALQLYRSLAFEDERVVLALVRGPLP